MPSLSSIWQARHEQMLQQEKISLKFPGPASVLRNYNSFTSYFRVRTTWDQAACRPGDRVLLIGDGGGKDYWFFAWQGITCQVIDVAPQSLIPEVQIRDISAQSPFPPESFDLIVMCDVLEHLYHDGQALANLRAMLKPSGRLGLSGPYWHDQPDHHVRIHSPRIIERMLRHHGFTIEKITNRGFLVGLYRLLHPAVLLLHYFLFQTTGRIYALAFNQFLFRAISGIQAQPWIPYLDRLIFGMAGGLNGYVLLAIKNNLEPCDIVALNREAFTDMGTTKSNP